MSEEATRRRARQQLRGEQCGGTRGARRDGGRASAGLAEATTPLEAAGAAAPSAGSGGCSGATAAASAGLARAEPPLEAAGAAAPSAGSATAAASAGLARAASPLEAVSAAGTGLAQSSLQTTPRSHARWCGASCH